MEALEFVSLKGADMGRYEDDDRATLKIDSDGRSSESSWYEIWESVNAMAYMCVTPAEKNGGRATKIGE